MKFQTLPAVLFLVFFRVADASATHIRGGEITFKQVPGTYEVIVTVTTLSNTDAQAADRPQLSISWGDGTSSDNVMRKEQKDISYKTWRNRYVATHTYPGPGIYVVSTYDPNRAMCENIPLAVTTPFYIESQITLTEGETVRSPEPDEFRIPAACAGRQFTYNLNKEDADEDSLYFSLIPPQAGSDSSAPNYSYPEASEYFAINNFTGEIIWEKPLKQGIYTVAVRTDEYRKGNRIEYVIRDFQIYVEAECNTSGILPAERGLQMTLIPNAGGNETRILFSVPVQKASLRLYDLNGRLVSLYDNIAGSELRLQTGHLPKGAYIVAVQEGGKCVTGRLALR